MSFRMNIIAITNQKGGVGKTTTAVNLSAYLGDLGKSVLLIDSDTQGNATSGLGVSRKSINFSLYDILVNPSKINDVIISTEFKNLKLIPSSYALSKLDADFSDTQKPEYKLKNALKCISEENLPDYVIIDCPPSINLLTINALVCSDYIIVPIQCEYYALEGLSQLVNSVMQIKKLHNNSLEILGILFTMYSKRLKLTMQVENEVKRCLKNKVFSTTIPRTVRLSEAPSFGKPILYFDKSSCGAKSYLDLTKEILNKCEDRFIKV